MDKRKIFISAHPTDRYLDLEPMVDAINKIDGCIAIYNPVPLERTSHFP